MFLGLLIMPFMVYVFLELSAQLPPFKRHKNCRKRLAVNLLKHRNPRTVSAVQLAINQFMTDVEELEKLALATYTPSIEFECGKEFIIPSTPDSPDLDLDELWEAQVFNLRLQCFQLGLMAKDPQHRLSFMYLDATGKVDVLNELAPSSLCDALISAMAV